jgi:prevent-host-death family protein
MCYGAAMRTVGARDLRNRTRAVLEQVEAGEPVTITVDGRPVAVLRPAIGRRPRSIGRAAFVELFASRQADAGLAGELRDLAPDTTDDFPR